MRSCPKFPGQAASAPDPQSSQSGAEFTVTLSPAVLLILRLIETANPHLKRDEILSRAIGHFAEVIGVPTLARDFSELPEFERVGVSRFPGKLSRSSGKT